MDYHNEYDAQKAEWLRHLIEEGAIPPGVVDCRPIQEVEPVDLVGFDRCHFFSGIGIWAYALGLAGWAPDVPVWTGSCPCGPFSRAGLQKGFDDPRHLWPEWFRLIRQCRPDCIFGEQSDAASQWIDLVSDNLEDIAYAFGAPDIPAAGFSGAHKRQRFYWVADTDNTEWWSERAPWHDGDWTAPGRVQGHGDAGYGGADSRLADPYARKRAERRPGRTHGWSTEQLARFGSSVGLGGPCEERLEGGDGRTVGFKRAPAQRAGGVDWLFGRDGAWRPVEPGAQPLAYESPARMGRLRGYGDAIDAETAAQFIAAYMECRP